jgi:uncharacterized peroxidase-related enzyme
VANVEPLPRDELEEFAEYFDAIEERSGYIANSLFTMARRPDILRAFSRLFGAVMRSEGVDAGLKQMVAQLASTSAGCRYCQSHTAKAAHAAGVPGAKVAALYEFETHEAFSEAERAALRLGRDAGLVPNAVTPTHFEELREHFDDGQIVELVSAIAMFGWLNRWNDTMATDLEEPPLAFAAGHLQGAGWEPGKHVHGTAPAVGD